VYFNISEKQKKLGAQNIKEKKKVENCYTLFFHRGGCVSDPLLEVAA